MYCLDLILLWGVKVKSNDVEAITVDGVNLSYTLRRSSPRLKALQLPEGAENLRISYSTIRPADMPTPYETMMHNKIQFQAVDKRNNRLVSILVRKSFAYECSSSQLCATAEHAIKLLSYLHVAVAVAVHTHDDSQPRIMVGPLACCRDADVCAIYWTGPQLPQPLPSENAATKLCQAISWSTSKQRCHIPRCSGCR